MQPTVKPLVAFSLSNPCPGIHVLALIPITLIASTSGWLKQIVKNRR